MKEENRFYNYVYLDPTKPCEYKIKDFDIILDYEPFYVGKGTGKRYKQQKYKPSGLFMKCKMQSMKKNNIEPIVIKIIDNISNEISCKNEKRLIEIIGRRDLGLGTLCNLTNGGEEGSGQIVSYETRMIASKRETGKKLSQEHKDKIGIANKGKKPSQATIEGRKKYLSNLIRKVKIKNPRKFVEVKMLDLNDNIVNIFKSSYDADKYMGYKPRTVYRQCLKLGKCRFKPFKFRFND